MTLKERRKLDKRLQDILVVLVFIHEIRERFEAKRNKIEKALGADTFT